MTPSDAGKHNFELNGRLATLTTTSEPRSSTNFYIYITPTVSNHFDVHVYNNSGTVVVGDNNVVSFVVSAASSASGLQRSIVPVSSPGATSENLRRKKNDRKRAQRKRRNLRTCDDLQDAMKGLALDDNSSFQQALQVFHCLITPLHPLRDNGLWAEFDFVAQELLDKAAGDLAPEIIICLEKSFVLRLKKELEQSEDMINNAARKIAQTSGSVRLLLEVLSKCNLAGLYRKKRMLGKTQECLEIARKIVSGFPPCLVVAIWLYEDASYKRDLASILFGSNKESAITEAKKLMGEAKKLMDECVHLSCRLDGDQVYVRKQHFCISKMASMCLHCETSASRKKSIREKDIAEARKCLATLENEYYSTKEVEGTRIQRLMAKADLFYREEKFAEAELITEKALEIAQRLDFRLDVKPLEERLTDIQQKIAESSSSETCRRIPRIIDSCSGSSKNNTPYSSEYEDKL